MSVFEQNFMNHGVHSTIETIRTKLEDIESKKFDDVEILDGAHRIAQAITHVSSVLKSVDPLLVSRGTLDQLYKILSNIDSDLNQFLNTNDRAHINQSNNRVDNLLVQTSNLNVSSDLVSTKESRRQIVSFKKSAGKNLSDVRRDANQLRNQFTELENFVKKIKQNIDGQEQRLNESIQNYQAQFLESETKRNDQFTAFMNEKIKKVDDELAERRTESELQKRQHEDFQKKIDVEHKAKMEAFDKKVKEITEEYIGIFKTKKKEIEDFMQVIIVTGIAGEYKQTAQAEQKETKKWQDRAVAAFVVLALVATATAVLMFFEEFRWELLSGRIFAATAIGILAAYFARQADRHEEAQRRARKMHLELTAIKPYLDDLPSELQHHIKEKLSEKLFGKEEPSRAKDKNNITGNSSDFVLKVFEMAKDIVKGSSS